MSRLVLHSIFETLVVSLFTYFLMSPATFLMKQHNGSSSGGGAKEGTNDNRLQSFIGG